MSKPKIFKKNHRKKFLSVFTLGLLAFSLLPDFFVPTTQVEAANSKVWTFQATNPSGGPTGGTTNSITDNSATITNGIYYWKVPHDGNYDINALGANHVSYPGANMKGTFSLTSGHILKILVGQQHITSGGVGGTFVTQNDNTPLIVAGGGGRRNSASLTTTGTSMSYGSSWTGTDVGCMSDGSFSGGTSGNGGPRNDSGAGLIGNGSASGSALSFINGGTGGGTSGGFGGGGNGTYGGSGGYSGGIGGAYSRSTCSETSYAVEWDANGNPTAWDYTLNGEGSTSDGGAGGASYNSGTNPTQALRNDGGLSNGSVTITLLTPSADLTSPTENFQLKNTNITLSWVAVGLDASKYDLVLEEKRPGDADFRTPVTYYSGTNTSYIFNIPNGTPGTTKYRWKIISYQGVVPFNSYTKIFEFANNLPVVTGSFTASEKDLSTSANKQHMKFTVSNLSDIDDYNYVKVFADIQEIAGSKKEISGRINYPISWTSKNYKLKVIPNFTNKTYGLSIVDSANESVIIANLFSGRAMQATNAPTPETFTFDVYAQDFLNIGDTALSTSVILKQTITVDTRNYLPRIFGVTSDLNGRTMSNNQGFNRIKFSGNVEDLDPDTVNVYFTSKLKTDTVAGQYIVNPNTDTLIKNFTPTATGVNGSYNSIYTIPSDIVSGQHVLLIYGVDSRGGIGSPHVIEFAVSHDNPVINFYANFNGNFITTAQRQVVGKDSKVKLYFTASNFTTLEYAGYHVIPEQQKASGIYTDLKIRGAFTNDVPAQFIGIDLSQYTKGDMLVFKFRAVSSTGVKIEKDVRIIIKNDTTQLTDLDNIKVPTLIRATP